MSDKPFEIRCETGALRTGGYAIAIRVGDERPIFFGPFDSRAEASAAAKKLQHTVRTALRRLGVLNQFEEIEES